jgi:hypothetical protein
MRSTLSTLTKQTMGRVRRGLSSKVRALRAVSFACPFPCYFRAVYVELHRTSRVRCHLPQAKYMKLRFEWDSIPVSHPNLQRT